MFQRCSDVVESRVEQLFDAESRNAASTSDFEQPRRASPWGTRGLFDNDSVWRAGLPLDVLATLVNWSDHRVADPSDNQARLSKLRNRLGIVERKN